MDTTFPQKVEWQKEYRPFPEQLNIDFGTMGGSSEFLISRLQKGLKSKIISNGETVQIRVLENKGLGNEDYQLHIDPNEILVSAAHYKGLFYGLGSLHQILYNAQNEGLGIPFYFTLRTAHVLDTVVLCWIYLVTFSQKIRSFRYWIIWLPINSMLWTSNFQMMRVGALKFPT